MTSPQSRTHLSSAGAEARPPPFTLAGCSAQIPKRVVQKGMKRARSPAGGAGEDAGPCRAGELAQGCRVATATGALFVHSGSSCLPPSRPARLRQGRAGRSLRRGAPRPRRRLRAGRSLAGQLRSGRSERKDMSGAWRDQVLLKEKGCHLKQ